MASFEWTTLYKAIAQTIFDTKDEERQKLIQEVLASLKKQDLLTDSFFNSGTIKRIDPLSLFGLFNYPGCPTRDILSIVMQKFKLSATIPSGILGIPSNYKGDLYLANPKRNKVSGFKETTGVADLCNLFDAAIAFSLDVAKRQAFVDAYNVVKAHRTDQKFEFTKRLYQMCPDTFLPLDDLTRKYLLNLLKKEYPTLADVYKNVLQDCIVPDGATYLRLIEAIRQKLEELNYDKDHPFVDLSFRAWIAPKNEHLSGICSEAYKKWSGKDAKDESILLFRERQKIWFGAPGTGKSFTVKKLVDCLKEVGGCSFRTTFHPDYDYATFVGCYKPCPEGKKAKEITYKFVPQVFTNAYVEAWKFWESSDEPKPVVLVIEEINRGNCAQIFGQIFQLLDRDKFGFSEYPVTMDQDLQHYLLASEIKGAPYVEGGELALPPNFFIFATMNTSDQSLFPMDSAFKRRWGWEYVPINCSNGTENWKISIGNNKYLWKYFLIAINQKILEKLKSPDKQLGERFVKADEGGIIDQKTFVNKVMFYLIGDAFKDDSTIREICKGDSDDKTEIVFADFADETKVKVDGKDKTNGAANLEKFFRGLCVNEVP